MNTPERTRQQLDPIGTYGNNLTTILFTMSAFAIAALLMVNSIDGTTNPPLAMAALLLLGVACTHLVLASNPIRAPFTQRTLTIILFTALVACGLELASEWNDGRTILGGWGPIALGFLILAMGPYRPPRELAAAGSIAAVLYGFLIVVHGGAASGEIPVLAVVAVTVMPILAIAFATAAHSKQVVDGLERWQHRVMRPERAVTRDVEDGIARSVQQDRVTILNREVMPFFLAIIEKPALTQLDRARAREIASSIRQVMVAEVDRSWLESAVEQFAAADRAEATLPWSEQTVRDDDHIANFMSYDQRTALRAFIGALHDIPEHGRGVIRIELFRDDTVCRAVIVVELEMADFALRSRFAPYFAVLRVMFEDLRLEYIQGVLTLSFSYEQR